MTNECIWHRGQVPGKEKVYDVMLHIRETLRKQGHGR